MVNPRELDYTIDVFTQVSVKTDAGEQKLTDLVLYSQIRCKELTPIKGKSGAEMYQGDQQVAFNQKSLLLRKEDRRIKPNKMYVKFEDEVYHISSVRRYKTSREWIVLDVANRDDE
jgi:head-tail adaptor